MVDVHPEWRELVEFAYDTLDKDMIYPQKSLVKKR